MFKKIRKTITNKLGKKSKEKIFQMIVAAGLLILLVLGAFGQMGWLPNTNVETGKRTGWFGTEIAKTSESSNWNPFAETKFPQAAPQLSKEYIYAGSRLLAIEEAGGGATPTPTPTATPTPTPPPPTPTPTGTPTPTPTPPPGGGLPSPWQGQDIGNPGVTGSSSHSSGTFTINGGGADIWGTSDQFYYIYQSLSGDGEIVARVTAMQNTNEWAKAGVMIRDTLAANSSYGITMMTPTNGSAFERRTAIGVGSVDSPANGNSTPHWVRLVRSGNSFTSYESSDGTNWTEIGTDTIAMTSDVYIGLAVTSHDDSVLNTSTFTDVSVNGGSPTPTPTATPTPTPTPTPTATPTPTPPPSGTGQAIEINTVSTNQYAQVTIPNTSPYSSLDGFQIVWRVRDIGYIPNQDYGTLFQTTGAVESVPTIESGRLDASVEVRGSDTHDGGVYLTPSNLADSICKIQYDPANSRWTYETWNSDGTGYQSNVFSITDTSNFNLAGKILTIGANEYGVRNLKGKLDYWRWIKRVESLGQFPGDSAPTGVTYLAQFEFEGNLDDSSGNGLNLTWYGDAATYEGSGTPTPTPTPTATPTPTPPPSGTGQAIEINTVSTNQYAQVTIPNTSPYSSLDGFQIVWRVRDIGYIPNQDYGTLFQTTGAVESVPTIESGRLDASVEVRGSDTHDGGVYLTPSNLADSICKIQYDPANSRWTYETWNSDGTGYQSNVFSITDTSNFNLAGKILTIGANEYGVRNLKGKLDYWRWIKRVESLGQFPGDSAPTGVTYLAQFEFEGNLDDSSGNGLNLTWYGDAATYDGSGTTSMLEYLWNQITTLGGLLATSFNTSSAIGLVHENGSTKQTTQACLVRVCLRQAKEEQI